MNSDVERGLAFPARERVRGRSVTVKGSFLGAKKRNLSNDIPAKVVKLRERAVTPSAGDLKKTIMPLQSAVITKDPNQTCSHKQKLNFLLILKQFCC